MTIWELEARRDRQYFKQVMESKGRDGLRSEMLMSLDRQADRREMDARVAQEGRSVATRPERQIELAFVRSPNAPVAAESGMVRVSANEARSPKMFVRNRSERPVRTFEVAWLLKDMRGREFVAGATPLDVIIQPRAQTTVVQDATFKFTQASGAPISLQEMTAFLTSVEFADGSVWVPSRSARWPTPSPEEQRLAEIYRKRGIEALVNELNRY